MKSFVLILSILAGTAFTVNAQTKTQETQEFGRAKYSELEPISYMPESNRKKVRLKTNARRTEPVAIPVMPEAPVAMEPKARVEGRLAEIEKPTMPAPAFK